jgi:hypothetical protein
LPGGQQPSKKFTSATAIVTAVTDSPSALWVRVVRLRMFRTFVRHSHFGGIGVTDIISKDRKRCHGELPVQVEVYKIQVFIYLVQENSPLWSEVQELDRG